MNKKIAALFLLPLGAVSLLPKSALATEATSFSPVSPSSASSVLVAQKYGAPPVSIQREINDNRQDRWDDRQDRWDDRRDRWNDHWDDRRDRWDNRRDRWNDRRDRWDDYRQESRRVWIPGHWEAGFLGIGRRWVDGHWEYRR